MILNEAKDIKIGDLQVDRVYLGDELVWGLPKGYTRCEYLEATGTQFIKTGIPIFYIDYLIPHIKCKVSFTRLYNYNTLWVIDTNEDLNESWVYYSGKWATRINYKHTQQFDIILDTIYNYEVILNGLIVTRIIDNDTVQIQVSDQPINKNEIINIWGGNPGNTHGSSKIYYFKLLDGEKLIWNGLPCLDQNNRPCFYDTISKTNFYNSGTGEFLYKLKE